MDSLSQMFSMDFGIPADELERILASAEAATSAPNVFPIQPLQNGGNEVDETFSSSQMDNANHPDPPKPTTQRFPCEYCSSTFSRSDNKKRHVKDKHGVEVPSASKSKGWNDALSPQQTEDRAAASTSKVTLPTQQMDNRASPSTSKAAPPTKQPDSSRPYACEYCEFKFGRKNNLKRHLNSKHNATKKIKLTPSHKNSAFDTFHVYEIEIPQQYEVDIRGLYENSRPQIIDYLKHELGNKRAVKWYLIMKLELQRYQDGETETIMPYIRSENIIELGESHFKKHLDEALIKIESSFDELEATGSGWQLEKILSFEFYSATYTPLAASSYIDLPYQLAAKKAILNIQNNDEKCFLWCLIAHRLNLDRENHPNRVENYLPFENMFKMGNVQFPVPINKIPMIEKMNNLRINVFGFEHALDIFPLYISPREEEDAINLMLISKGDQRHYCLIRDMSRLLAHLTNHNGTSFYCMRCLHRFAKKETLDEHLKICQINSVQRIILPEDGDNLLKFRGEHMQHKIPYIIFCDFESLIVPIPSSQSASVKTEKVARHIPCGYAYVIVDEDGKSVKPIQQYRGEKTVEKFIEAIMMEREFLVPKLTTIQPIHMSREEEEDFRTSTHCALCKKLLGTNRVRDHDHLTSRYRGALHRECNLKLQQPKKIPIVFHNLKSYDGHFIVMELAKYKEFELQIIPITTEKYMSIIVRKRKCPVSLVFLDSLQFMPASLDKLAQTLKPDQFHILKENFHPSTHFDLLLRKGVYPYEYFSSFEKFAERQLPQHSDFFNQLTGKNVSYDDYSHAQKIWDSFQMTTLGDYHDLYLKTDVLLLADIFINFRRLCFQYYGIDCPHVFSAPGLSWHSCLKMCDITLELLTDIDLFLTCERAVRGGVSVISHRWAKANHPSLQDYDASLPISEIMYFDCTNLYGISMEQPLPYKDFKWEEITHVTAEWILSRGDFDEIGYILVCDLECPPEIHDFTADYPLAAERITVEESMLSPFQKNLLKGRKFVKTPKLIPNLNPKFNYVVHYRNLKFYLEIGMKIIKVHKMISFKQKAWLKPYIQFNTEKRRNANSAFEKDFFKLANNSIYGKTMENLRNRRDILLCTDERGSKKLIASPSFQSFNIFSEDLVAVERKKTVIKMDRPVYVGFCILELSKLIMFDFHYNFIKKTFGPRAKLLFTDTDSLAYHIEEDNLEDILFENSDLFDFSDYPTQHRLFSEKNKKIAGKFKDELNGKRAIEFIGLKSKMYSLLTEVDEKKRAKGVCTRIVREKIKHQDYKNCLEHNETTVEEQMRIGSEKHELFTIRQNKVALNAYDDKRFILSDGYSTLPYGHYRISEMENE